MKSLLKHGIWHQIYPEKRKSSMKSAMKLKIFFCNPFWNANSTTKSVAQRKISDEISPATRNPRSNQPWIHEIHNQLTLTTDSNDHIRHNAYVAIKSSPTTRNQRPNHLPQRQISDPISPLTRNQRPNHPRNAKSATQSSLTTWKQQPNHPTTPNHLPNQPNIAKSAT